MDGRTYATVASLQHSLLLPSPPLQPRWPLVVFSFRHSAFLVFGHTDTHRLNLVNTL